MKDGEALGVIGYRAGGNVQRLPSSVYWQGLRRLGALNLSGSEADYARSLRAKGKDLRDDDGEPVNAGRSVWDPQLPKPPDGWLDATNFALSREEAEYLTARVNFAAPKSLLAHLLHLAEPPGNTSFPWEHVPPDELPPALGEELGHAQNFSETMHGASLLYNLMLARERESGDLIKQYEEWLAEWWEMLKERSDDLSRWNRLRLWVLLAEWRVRVPAPTHNFVETWLGAIGKTRRIETILSDHGLHDLIRQRERLLKRARARLGNPKALGLWSGRSGAGQLDYRWVRPVRQMLDDLIRRPAKVN